MTARTVPGVARDSESTAAARASDAERGRVAAVTEPWLYDDPLVPVDRRCEHAAEWTRGCRAPGDLAPAMRAFVNREDLGGPVSAAS